MSSNVESNVRQDFDEIIQNIIEFVYEKDIDLSLIHISEPTRL